MTAPGALGDYIRALQMLWPVDGDAAASIARACGLVVASAGERAAELSGEATEVGEAPHLVGADRSLAALTLEEEGRRLLEAAAARRPRLRPGRRAARPVASDLRRTGRIARERPQWLLEASPLEARATVPDPPEPEPLFLPRWTAGIIAGALATVAHDGGIDVKRLVDRLARQELLDELPRLAAPTLREGAQVLVDLGEAMAPYLRDEQQLLSAIRRVVGREATTVLRFAGCPGRGAGPAGRRTWRRYELPAASRPVVVISDLGLTGPRGSPDYATRHEWREFAQAVGRAGCPLVAITPYASDAVPAELRRLFAIVTWDRPTTAGSAIRATRRRQGR